MADISKIILPNGDQHTIKDATARSGLSNKVDKVTGKGLSTNDFTDTLETKLNGIAAGAEVNVQSDWNVTDSASDAFIKNKPTIPTVPGAATATPKMDGTAAVGSSTKYAKEDHVHPSDTSKVSHADYDPLYGIGTGNLIMQGRVDYTRPNRLAFLPADQIIIEQTTDGGTTWVDTGVTDTTKAALFSGVTNAYVYIPLLNGARSTQCGIRITFTAMKYDVPSGTGETDKYQYWNSNHVKSTERYCSLDRLWFWLGSNGDTLRIQLYRANGGTPDNWVTAFNTDFGANGWSGSDWIQFSYGAFGGGTNQTGQPWNYRLTIFSRLQDGKTAFTQTNKQVVYRIYGYGENCWTARNSLMQTDHLYSMDVNKNATFPASVTATGGFSGNLTGNVTGNASGVTTQGNGTTDVARHVWFSDSGTETKRAHDDDFKYNPATNVLTVGNVNGKINNHTVNADVPANAKFTDTVVTKTSELTNDSNFVVDANYVHTDNNYTSTEKTKLAGVATGAEANVQSDWNETDTSSDAYVLNKPNPYLLENFIAIPDGSDLNDYTTPGEYYVSSDDTSVSHCPRSGLAFRLRVENNPTASYIKQTFSIRVNNNLYPYPITWFRFYRADTQVWSSWMGDTQHLMGHINLHDDDDLNSFIELGEYECTLTSRALTITNRPSDMNVAFRLRVEAGIQGYNGITSEYLYRRQTLYPYNSSNVYYTRTYIIEGAGTETWSSWIKCGVPISHASTATTYGQGDASNYGHVKLSDTYSSKVSGGDAAGGIAASQNALYNVYNGLRTGTIPAHNFVANNLGGVATDDNGNFYHNGSTATSNYWAVKANNGTYDALRVYFETGKIIGGGTTLVWGPGDTATFSDQIAGALITNSMKRVAWSLPCYTSTKVADAQITALSVTLRYADGGYAHMCYGSSNNQYQQLGTGRISIWANSKTVQTNGVSTVDCNVNRNHLYIWIDFVNTLRTGANTTTVPNNSPMSIQFNMTIKFT